MTPQQQEAAQATFSDWYQLHGEVGTWAGYEAGWAAALAWRARPPSLVARSGRYALASVVYGLRWLITSDTKEELTARRAAALKRYGTDT